MMGADGIKGFLHPEEGQALYRYGLKAGRLGPSLEIGSYCGKSASYLGRACRVADRVLFSVDHHRGSEEQQPGETYFDPELIDPARLEIDTLPFFRRALAETDLESWVVPLVCTSVVAARCWQTPLGLVFIDGGHAEETVQADFNAWWRHILPAGYLLIHDLFEDPSEGGQGPIRVYRQALQSGRFKALATVRTLGVLQRLKKPSP